MPTTSSQEDPFYKKQHFDKSVSEDRLKINKAIMNSTKNTEKQNLICKPYDFSVAARNAIDFAFRQYVLEEKLLLGDKWKNIVEIYYSGQWPIGYTKDKLVII